MAFVDSDKAEKYYAEYRATHREEARAYAAKYRKEHREELPVKRKQFALAHPEAEKRWNRQYYLRHRDKHLKHSQEQAAKQKRDLRVQLFVAYAPRCLCCGETNKRFLCLHHVNGGGGRDRLESGWAAAMRRAIAAKNPEHYQILCFNCHMGLHVNGGICPHKQIEEVNP